MTMLRQSTVRRSAWAGCLAATLAAAAAVRATPADVPPAADQRPRHHAGGAHAGLPFGHLRGLDLTEAQQDKLFALLHAEAPQRREQDKTIARAHEMLRSLNEADRFDEARAAAAARDLGQAIGARALAQARLDAQVLAVLTPEQRSRLRQRRGPRGPERAEERGGERGGEHDGERGGERGRP